MEAKEWLQAYCIILDEYLDNFPNIILLKHIASAATVDFIFFTSSQDARKQKRQAGKKLNEV
jgi:response regulator of citrate/malate metabolism